MAAKLICLSTVIIFIIRLNRAGSILDLGHRHIQPVISSFKDAECSNSLAMDNGNQCKTNIDHPKPDFDPFDMSGGKKYSDVDTRLNTHKDMITATGQTNPFNMRSVEAYSYNRAVPPKSTFKSIGLGLRVFNWLKKMSLQIIYSPELVLTCSILIMTISMVWSIIVNQSYRFAIINLLFMVFISGYGFIWIRKYEEKEIERYYDYIKYGTAPYHCRGEHLAWYEQSWYYLFGEDCLKFYKRRDVRPMLKVSPIDIFLDAVSLILIEPVKSLGLAYSAFVSGALSDLPWILQIFVIPAVHLISAFLAFIVIALFWSYHFSISPITGIRLYPSVSCSNPPHRQENKYLEDISNKVDMINAKVSLFNLKESKESVSQNKCDSCLNKGLHDNISNSDKGNSEKRIQDNLLLMLKLLQRQLVPKDEDASENIKRMKQRSEDGNDQEIGDNSDTGMNNACRTCLANMACSTSNTTKMTEDGNEQDDGASSDTRTCNACSTSKNNTKSEEGKDLVDSDSREGESRNGHSTCIADVF